MSVELPRGTAESFATLEPNSSKKYFSHLFRVLLFAVFVLTACTKPEPAPPPPPPPEPEPPVMIEHVVKYSGETLGLIARWYTGKSANWPLVVEANPGLVPERINIGDRILIPEDIVVEKNPMPSRAVRAVSKKAEKTDAEIDSTKMEAEDWLDVGSDGSSEGSELVPEAEIEDSSQPEAEMSGDVDVQPSDSLGKSQSSDDKLAVPEPKAQDEEPKKKLSEEDAERERLLDELLAE